MDHGLFVNHRKAAKIYKNNSRDGYDARPIAACQAPKLLMNSMFIPYHVNPGSITPRLLICQKSLGRDPRSLIVFKKHQRIPGRHYSWPVAEPPH